MSARLDIYRDTTGDWRWRVLAANGRVVADSAEGYRRRGAALRGFEITRSALPPAPAIKPGRQVGA